MGGVLFVLVVLICVLAVLEVHGQNPGQCADDFITDIKADKSVCPTYEEYYTCLFQEIQLDVAKLTEPQIMDAVTFLNDRVSPNCRIDYKVILKKFKDEVNPVFVHPPSQPKGYDDAVTVGDCLNTIHSENMEVGNPTCQLFAPGVKCMVRVSEIYNHEAGSKHFQKELQVLFQWVGMDCKFDLQAISAEVASEQASKNADPGLITNNPVALGLLLPWICSRF